MLICDVLCARVWIRLMRAYDVCMHAVISCARVARMYARTMSSPRRAARMRTALCAVCATVHAVCEFSCCMSSVHARWVRCMRWLCMLCMVEFVWDRYARMMIAVVGYIWLLYACISIWLQSDTGMHAQHGSSQFCCWICCMMCAVDRMLWIAMSSLRDSCAAPSPPMRAPRGVCGLQNGRRRRQGRCRQKAANVLVMDMPVIDLTVRLSPSPSPLTCIARAGSCRICNTGYRQYAAGGYRIQRCCYQLDNT